MPRLNRAIPAVLLFATLTLGAACTDSALTSRVDDLESQISADEDLIAALKTSVRDLEDELATVKIDLDDAQTTADEAKTMADEAKTMADANHSYLEEVALAIDGLTIDDIRFGNVGVSCP
jgi:chromosome segregation ATPase